MHVTYFIPKTNEAVFLKKMKVFANRVNRLGLGELTFEVVKTFLMDRSVPRRAYNSLGDPETRYERKPVEHVAYTLEGPKPVLNGWEFVATLAHEGGETLVNVAPDTVLPDQYRHASPQDCDHCGHVRDRRDTFVVRHESGEHKQVGRTCLKDFMGFHDPMKAALLATLLQDVWASVREFYEDGEALQKSDVCGLGEFLTATVWALEEYGWVSRTAAREDPLGRKLATADLVLMALRATHPDDRPSPTKEQCELARKVEDWVANQEPSNDYMHNLQVIVRLGYVTGKTAGYAASMVNAYGKAMERECRKGLFVTSESQYVGDVGKRMELEVTLTRVIPVDGFYGVSYLHKFVTPVGDVVVWFASNPNVVPSPEGKDRMVENATYRVKATPKKHETYNGGKQTTVTRVAVQPLGKKRRGRKKKSTQAELPV